MLREVTRYLNLHIHWHLYGNDYPDCKYSNTPWSNTAI